MAGVKTRAQRKKQADTEPTAASPLHELSMTITSKATRTKNTSKTKKPVSEETAAPAVKAPQDDTQDGEAPYLPTRNATGPFHTAASSRSPDVGRMAHPPPPPPSEDLPITNVKQFFTVSVASDSEDDLVLGSSFPLRPMQKPHEPHSLIHIWIDPSTQILKAARPRTNPTIAVAFPSSDIEAILKVLAGTSSRQQSITVLTHPAATQNLNPSPSKRKLPDDAEMPQPSSRPRIEHTKNKIRRTRSGICEEVAQIDGISPVKRQRRHINTSLSMSRNTPKGKKPDRPRPKHHYNEKGELILEATSEASDSEHIEELAKLRRSFRHSSRKDDPVPQTTTDTSTALVPYDSSKEVSTEPPLDAVTQAAPAEISPLAGPSTPPRSGWGLGSILSSARTVTRFFPSLGRSRPVFAPVAPATIATSHVAPRKDSNPNTAVENGSPSSAPENGGIPGYDGGTDLTPTPSQSRNSSHDNNIIESSNSSMHIGSSAENDTQSRTTEMQQSHQNSTPANSAIRSTNVEAQTDSQRKEHEQAETTADQSVGSKRKRAASPKSIPNPPGAYGMVDEFFDDSSSDDDGGGDVSFAPATPTPKNTNISSDKRSRKRPRIENQSTQRSSTGPSSTPRANFARSAIAAVKNPNDRGYLDPKDSHFRILDGDIRIDANFTGMVNPAQPNSFKVPGWETDDSSIDDDDEDNTLTLSSAQIANVPSSSLRDAETLAATNVFAASTNSRTKPDDGNSISNGATAGKPSPNKQANNWSQPPPPPPNPSHATLPVSSGPADSERLSAARAKALQHAPKRPSTLRESSRISSSPAAPLVEEVEEASNAPSQGIVRGRKPLGEVCAHHQIACPIRAKFV